MFGVLFCSALMFHSGNSVPGRVITRSTAGAVLITFLPLRGPRRTGTWEAQVGEPRNRKGACFGLPSSFPYEGLFFPQAHVGGTQHLAARDIRGAVGRDFPSSVQGSYVGVRSVSTCEWWMWQVVFCDWPLSLSVGTAFWDCVNVLCGFCVGLATRPFTLLPVLSEPRPHTVVAPCVYKWCEFQSWLCCLNACEQLNLIQLQLPRLWHRPMIPVPAVRGRRRCVRGVPSLLVKPRPAPRLHQLWGICPPYGERNWCSCLTALEGAGEEIPETNIIMQEEGWGPRRKASEWQRWEVTES